MEGDGFIVQAPEWSQQLKYLEICRVCLSNQQLKQRWRSCGLLDSATSFTEFSILGIPAPCAALALRKSISWDSTKTVIKTPINQINRSKAKSSLGYITLLLFFQWSLWSPVWSPTSSTALCSTFHAQFCMLLKVLNAMSSQSAKWSESPPQLFVIKFIQQTQCCCELEHQTYWGTCSDTLHFAKGKHSVSSNDFLNHQQLCHTSCHCMRPCTWQANCSRSCRPVAHLSQVCLSHLTSLQSPLARQPTLVIYMAWLWWNSDDVYCIPTEHRYLELGLILTWRPGLPLDLGLSNLPVTIGHHVNEPRSKPK